MNPFFDSLQAKIDIENLYHYQLENLGIRYELKIVETSFGNTNVIITGTMDTPPLVLLHGTNSCAPIALATLQGLEKEFRIYAVDILGQPNLSDPTRLDKKDNTYGQWMFEILSCLNLWQVTLVGMSLGGFINLKTIVFDGRRIANVFLFAPEGIINGHHLSSKELNNWRRNPTLIEQYLAKLFTDKSTLAYNFLSKVLLHFEMDFSSVPIITMEETQKIKTPINFIAAENDDLFPSAKILERAKAIFPTLHQTLLLKNARHFPSSMDNQLIVEFIKKKFIQLKD